MNDTTGTLGHAIFSGLEKNEYLNEIYDALLHNDFLRLFHINDTAAKEVSTEDALRFADLLSKSINTDQSEQHRSLAQEIITLLDMLNPDDEEIRYVMGAVLSSTSNYLGCSIAFLISKRIMFLTVCQMKLTEITCGFRRNRTAIFLDHKRLYTTT
jgi:hypothetical protein